MDALARAVLIRQSRWPKCPQAHTLLAPCGLGRSAQAITVRLAEIDAPEKAQPWGNRSKQHLSKVCFQKQAELRPQTSGRGSGGEAWPLGRPRPGGAVGVARKQRHAVAMNSPAELSYGCFSMSWVVASRPCPDMRRPQGVTPSSRLRGRISSSLRAGQRLARHQGSQPPHQRQPTAARVNDPALFRTAPDQMRPVAV